MRSLENGALCLKRTLAQLAYKAVYERALSMPLGKLALSMPLGKLNEANSQKPAQ